MIAIKGIRMPESCDHCPCMFHDYTGVLVKKNGWVCNAIYYNRITGAHQVYANQGRPSFCPLVEVKDEIKND